MFWIEGEDWSARWESATDDQIDLITAYIESVLGKPDTVA